MNRCLEDFVHTTWSRRGLLSHALLPLSWLYGRIALNTQRRQTRTAWRAPVPVLVIGNILVGGTGKTPVTTAVCLALQAGGWQPGIISRGYGAKIGSEPHLSDEASDSTYLGDEPALLHTATSAPVAVHPRRSLAAAALLSRHPDIDVLLADDGLQHRALARDLEIIVQDVRGSGNGRLLPAGPLREPASRLQDADWLITHLGVGDCGPAPSPWAPDPRRCIHMQLQPASIKHLASGQQQPWGKWLAQHQGISCSAVAGIGQPQRFFNMLRNQGLNLQQTLSIPDHRTLSVQVLQSLPPGPILMTPKDAVKCRPPHKPHLWAVEAMPVFSDPTWLDALQADLRKAAATLTHKDSNRH